MKHTYAFLIFLTFIMGSLPGFAEAKTTVRMTAQGFEPKEVTIQKGETVVFVNEVAQDRWPASNIHPTHEIYPEFDPKTTVGPGKSWEFTFDKAGTWKYHDHLLSTMSGTITVTDDGRATVTNDNNNDRNKAPGFWHKIWNSISSWWHGLWNEETKLNEEAATSTKYDANITQNDERIFTEEQPLASYVHKYGAKQTIAQLHALETKLGSCHQPAHRAGHLGYEQLGDHALIEYSPECQSGYYHGVMEAYFKDHGTSNLSESFTTLCPSNLNNFFEHQCVHGIGHGLMAWSNYELPDALAGCDQLPRRQDSCWTGVFMENLSAQIAKGNQSSSVGSTDVHLTKYLKDEDPLYPCDGIAEKYQNSCYFLQTSRMLQIFGQDFKKVAASCATAPEIYQPSCFGSMGRDVGGNFPTDNARQIRECAYVSTEANKTLCLNGAVQNSFWDPSGQTRAIDFCTKLTNNAEKQSCYNTIFQRATELFTTADGTKSFCAAVEANYINSCKEQVMHVYN